MYYSSTPQISYICIQIINHQLGICSQVFGDLQANSMFTVGGGMINTRVVHLCSSVLL